ncbi:MAG: hypothetical protein ICV60_15110 [Pyrinomonadaceae bacterium]|nr:hypothetical protein [Pyrinomonadaceae bacterium]
MYGTRTTLNLERPPEGNDVHARLNWLLAVNAQAERRRRMFRNLTEEEEVLLMRHPLSTRQSFALFGLLLGIFPPAAIFSKIFGYGLSGPMQGALLFLACLGMNVICAWVGYVMGKALSGAVESAERDRWDLMMVLIPLLGAGWGAVTGFAGGLIFFGIGAIFGAICAIVVGTLAFTMFAPLHRLNSRGGMIDARHFWPLATGATVLISALILGLGN